MKYRLAVAATCLLLLAVVLPNKRTTPKDMASPPTQTAAADANALVDHEIEANIAAAKRLPIPPDVLERTIQSALTRGWKPTGHVATISRGQRHRATRPVRQDDSVTTSDGEVTIWDWDDSDWNTAEGTIYIEEYATGESMTFNVQFYVNNDDTYETIWGEVTQNYIGSGVSDNRPSLLRRPEIRRVGFEEIEYCCVRYGSISSEQMGRLNNYITVLTQNTTEVSGIGGAIGAAWTSLKTTRNPAASIIVGALEGVGLSAVGNFIYNLRHSNSPNLSVSDVMDEMEDELRDFGCQNVIFLGESEDTDPRCLLVVRSPASVIPLRLRPVSSSIVR